MNILYWLDLFSPHVGGIETFSLDLIPALQARGHEVTVLTSSHIGSLPKQELIGSIPVYRFDMWEALRKNDLAKLFAVRRAVTSLKEKLKPDVIHLHFGATAFFHLQTQKTSSPPTLTTVHALPPSSLKEHSLFHKVVNSSRWVNAVSRKGLETLRQTFPESGHSFSSVNYALRPGRPIALEITQPSFDKPVLLCLGRLTPQKGFDIALEAFAEVEKIVPAARMMIVGEGIEDAALKDLAARLCIAEKVEFTGLIEPELVFEVFNQATMVLMPSKFEGLPLVALQAAFMQRPIISTDVDGFPDLVVHQETGILLGENTRQALAEAILQMLNEPRKAVAMGQAAGRHLEKYFNFEDCVSNYEELYRRIHQ